jgi:hypothetical protein
MPWPSSRTRISDLPPFSISICTLRAPASRAFLDQLLHHRRGALDDLPRRDLVDEVVGRRWMRLRSSPSS